MRKDKKKNSAKTINEIYNETLLKYMHREYITGIDIGYKYVNSESTEKLAIRFHVKEKIPKSALDAIELFPEEIEGFPIDVIQGNYKLAGQPVSIAESTNRTMRFARLQPGISVANPKSSIGGTLGMFVTDRNSGRPAILSNWHVLAGALARRGDSIVQPGPGDGGMKPRDTIAELERWILDKDGDAAIAILNNSRPFDPTVIDLNITPDTIAFPQHGDIVIKSGRSTQVTRGRVDGIGSFPMEYPRGVVWIDGFKIVPEGSANKEVSYTGDSGSIWIKEGTRTALGLHFAGEPESSPMPDYALACFASSVFFRLGIQPLLV